MDDYVAKPIRPTSSPRRSAVLVRSPAGRAREERRAGSVLDGAALDRLREAVGDEFVGELVDTFLGDAPGQLATLRGARRARRRR